MKTFLFFWILTLGWISSAQENPFDAHYDVFSKHEVIAFGEACHGSYSDYVARKQLIQTFTSKGQKVHVLIEMPAATGPAIQQYYANTINADSLLRIAAYYGLQTDGFLDFIDAFKNDSLVAFRGIDVQTLQPELNHVCEHARARFPEQREELALIFDSLNHDFAFGYTDSSYHHYRPVIERNMQKLSSIMHPRIISAGASYHDAVYLLNTLHQHFQLLDYIKSDQEDVANLYRDSCMAHNILYMNAQTCHPIIVLAANGHVIGQIDKKYTMMGGHLKQALQDDYYVIASQYLSGELLEVDVVDGKREISKVPLRPLPKKSLPSQLDQLLHPTSNVLITHSHSNKAVRKLLGQKTLGQDMGTGAHHLTYELGGYFFFRPEEFNALYIIPKVVASEVRVQ